MSSDEQNINQVQYSDDSDYEHRDSVLSTGHRNSLAHRQSVSNRQSIGNRQSKRLSYGKKHNESKIEEILNKVEEEPVVIHQTESHIVGEGEGEREGEKKTQDKQQDTVVSSDVGHNSETVNENEPSMNYSQMLVSINDSQNQSDVFEVMEMSQASQQQQPQSKIYIQVKNSYAEENPAKNVQVVNDDLDYLPEEPYVETHRDEAKGTTNEQGIQNEAQRQNETGQQVEQQNSENQAQRAQQQQQPPQQQQPQAQQPPTHHQSQPLTQQITSLPQSTIEPQAHSLGDEFNQNQQQAQQEILNSFRDSTEEKRRNRVPGNSQIQFGEQSDYYGAEDGVSAYGRGNEEVREVRREEDERKQEQEGRKEVEEQRQQQEVKNGQKELEPQQTEQEAKEQTTQQPIAQTQAQPHATQQTQLTQHQQQPQTQQAPNQPEQQDQQQSQANDQTEHIITSQVVDLPQEPELQKQQQAAQVEQLAVALSQEKHSQQEDNVQVDQVSQHGVESNTQQEEHPQTQVQQQQVKEVAQGTIVETQVQQIPPTEQQQEQWPTSYGQPQQQQQQYQQQAPQAHPQQPRHQQVQSIVSQPNPNPSSQEQYSNQQQQPSTSALDQRIPLPDSDQQAANNTSNILPSSEILSKSQQDAGMVSVISFTTQRQSQQIQVQEPQESTVFERFEGIEVDITKVNPSHIVPSKIRNSNRSLGEVGELESEKDPSQIIEQSLEQSRNGIQTVQQQQQQADSSQPTDHPTHPQQYLQPPQNQSQSEFIKIQQDNSSFAQSQSNMRYIQSDIPMVNHVQVTHSKPSQNQLLAEVQPAVMTRVESEEELPETPVKQLGEGKGRDLEASEYFVVGGNLSSLDIYGRSEYNNNQMAQTAQPNSNQSISQRESVLPHPLKNQLLKQAQKKKEQSNNESTQQQPPKASQHLSARVSAPKATQPQQQQKAPKYQQPQQPLRNSVSNADLVLSTSELKTTNKPKKEKAGSSHKAHVENPESCKCEIF